MARPSSLSHFKPRILEGVRNGLTYERASHLAGVSIATFMSWKKKGTEQTSGQYRDFLDELRRAEEEGELACLEGIRQAARGGSKVVERRTSTIVDGKGGISTEETITEKVALPQWQAHAWWLERRFPNTYGKKERPSDAPPPVLEVRILSKEESKPPTEAPPPVSDDD